MGLFDKKQCAICGEDIGFLGNRKLADGNMCSKCAAKLSPFFTERKASTIEEIRQQLAYREANRTQLESFTPNKVYNEGMVIYLDDIGRRFVITRSSDYRSGNPDIIDCAKVLSAEYTVHEDKDEIYKDDDKKTSFDPPRYKFEYTFNMKLTVDHPYFDTIRFEVKEGDRPTSKVSAAYKAHEKLCNIIQNALRPDLYPLKVFSDTANAPQNGNDIGSGLVNLVSGIANALNGKETLKKGEWQCECGAVNTTRFCGNCGREKPLHWFCPNCGTENSGKFCVGCGTQVPESVLNEGKEAVSVAGNKSLKM